MLATASVRSGAFGAALKTGECVANRWVIRPGRVPSSGRRRTRPGLLGLIVSFTVFLGLAATSAASSLGTASFSAADGGGIDISWNASCDELNYWAVNVLITYTNGDKANGSGYLYDNHDGSDSSASDTSHWVVPLPEGVTSEMVYAQVTVECPNGSTDAVIGEAEVTVGSGFGSHGSGSVGSGSGSGSGGSGKGGSGSGSGGSGNGGSGSGSGGSGKGGSGSGSGSSGKGGSGSGSGGSGNGGSGSGSGGSGNGGSGSGSRSHCVVPKLVGKTLAASRKLLTHAHCALGTVTRPRVPSGRTSRVRSSSPRAGTRLPAGSKVDIKLGKR
jgi:PASTA domain